MTALLTAIEGGEYVNGERATGVTNMLLFGQGEFEESNSEEGGFGADKMHGYIPRGLYHIGDNLVLVKETYENFAGEQTTKDVELRIRLSQGG